MYRRLALLTVGLVLLGSSSLRAQDAILGQMYGAGVHAFFAGDFAEAHENLTTAISGGSQDPRCHYFRGLSYLELGREEEAKMDFEAGAKLETGDVNRFFNVPGALERVQGKSRVLLETYRAQGRLAALENERKLRAQRYEQFQVEQTRVLEGQIESAPALPDDADVTAPAAIDPFGVETAPAAVVEPAEVEATEPAAPADPFGAEPTEEPAAPEVVEPADPFGSEAPAMTEEPAASIPADVEPANVLGALGSLLGGSDVEEEPAFGGMGEDPFGSDDGADPFDMEEEAPSIEDVAPPAFEPADEEAAPAVVEPADDEEEAAPAADPFGNPFE